MLSPGILQGNIYKKTSVGVPWDVSENMIAVKRILSCSVLLRTIQYQMLSRLFFKVILENVCRCVVGCVCKYQSCQQKPRENAEAINCSVQLISIKHGMLSPGILER